MSLKTKLWYSEQVLNQLQDGFRNRDEKFDQREILVQFDNVINRMAKENYLENWKLGVCGVDDLWTTKFDNIVVNDPDDEGPSWVTIPASYVILPRGTGIQEVTFVNDFETVTKKYFSTVYIVSEKDAISYRRNPAGSMQGGISVFPRGGKLYFSSGMIGSTYGNVSISLVIKDSTAISDSAPYPIPANVEAQAISECVQWFLMRRSLPETAVRDGKDKV